MPTVPSPLRFAPRRSVPRRSVADRPAPRRFALLSGALLFGWHVAATPDALAQQYAVPAGAAIVLQDEELAPPPLPVPAASDGANAGTPEASRPGVGGAPVGQHSGSGMHGAYQSGPAFGSYGPGVVAEAYPTVRSTQYPIDHGGGRYVFDEPSYAGPVVESSICDECGPSYGPGGYGDDLMGLPIHHGGYHDAGYCDGYGCDSVCGPVGCLPGDCDPTCEGDLVCGGPVVCNKFGRCGKFYTNATSRDACGLSAGYGFLFLRPSQGDATAAVVRSTVGRTTTSTRQEFEYSLDSGSRIFVELIRPDAIGVRLTFSGLEADSDNLVFLGRGNGGVSSAALPSALLGSTNNP
ncbi:MAG: hypothetical protein AAF907_17325, partial [Planctomycetota bacterium]